MKQFAPAKINLYLHILGKRPDGFHELETFMVPLSLGDELDIELGGEGVQLTCSNPNLPATRDNLAWKAADLFRSEFGIRDGIRIHLDKRTPVGAGLGGGSSDAAAVLLALNQLTKTGADEERLAGLAAQLGSDIPFFIYGKPAVCKGRGEIIEPSDAPVKLHGLLVHPGFGVSTPWAYQTYAKNPSRGIEGKSWGGGTLRNDLEPPVFGKYVWIPAAKKWFQEQEETHDSLMSGSGSSVFALTKDAAGAAELRERFLKEFGEELFAETFQVN